MNRDTLYEQYLTHSPLPDTREDFDRKLDHAKAWVFNHMGGQIQFDALVAAVGKPFGKRLQVCLDELRVPDPTPLEKLEALMDEIGPDAQAVLDEYCKRHVWTDEADPKHIDCRRHIECICHDEQKRIEDKT